jgi:hypothetical protein
MSVRAETVARWTHRTPCTGDWSGHWDRVAGQNLRTRRSGPSPSHNVANEPGSALNATSAGATTRSLTHVNGQRAGRLDPGLGRPGGGLEAVHEEVQQATGLGFMLGPGGDGEDADERVGDVFGGDVGAEVARRAASVENRGDGRQ